jgi:hypothetical protein
MDAPTSKPPLLPPSIAIAPGAARARALEIRHDEPAAADRRERELVA